MRPALVLLGCLALGGPVAADSVVTTTGRVIDVERAWFEGRELRYRKDGVVYSLPRSLVVRVATDDGRTAEDPDVVASRKSLVAGDAREALRHARLALFRDPSSVPGLQALAAAQLATGDAARARATASTALGLDPRSPLTLELLGDALSEEGDFAGARERYRQALEAAASPQVRSKLEALDEPPASASTARFLVRYDGAADEPMGLAVLRVLDSAWEEFERRLGGRPAWPVTVVLQTATAFTEATRAPGWAAGLYDGTIRVPVKGLERPTPGLVRVLRHELAHSFVGARAGETCPTWLQEGIAQWLEGGSPEREDAGLARRARVAPLPPLRSLEKPFVGLSEGEATIAYARSLSAVAHLLRLGGEASLRRLLAALGEGRAVDTALADAYGLGYAELQGQWEARVRGAGL